jgi:ribosomal protein S18 acetylase RimI-like enzyme
MTTMHERSRSAAAAREPDRPAADRPVVRPYRGPEDHPTLTRIGSAARAANGNPEQMVVAQFDNDYAHLENCDLPRDCRIVEIDGRGVAYGRTFWVDRNSGERAYEGLIFIDPAFPERGVETALLGWEIGHLEELAGLCPPDPADRPTILVAYAHGRDHASRALLESAGFADVRRGATLVRSDFEGIPDLPLPDGFALRPIDPTDRTMHRRVFDAAIVAFADHWGDSESDGSESSFEAFVGDPLVRPDLWRVAFHGDEIAGQILNFLDPAHDDGTVIGWTESISVQPEFRRRGIARALLAESLRTVRDAGATRAALGVDTGNTRRALDLYESLGFRIVSESIEYQRPVGEAVR